MSTIANDPASDDFIDRADRYADSLRHINLIAAKRAKLAATQMKAEEQLLWSIQCDIVSGALTRREAVDVYADYRELSGPGFSKRWDATVKAYTSGEISFEVQHAYKYRANGAGGSFVGPWPLSPEDPRPRTGDSVVYVLFDSDAVACYVGSTQSFKPRLATHLREGKPFVSWQAYVCRDREAAYVLEEQMLREHMPYLNRKAGR